MKLVLFSVNMREYLFIVLCIIVLISNRGMVYKLFVFFVFFIVKICFVLEVFKNVIVVGNNIIGFIVKFLCKEGFFWFGRLFISICWLDG